MTEGELTKLRELARTDPEKALAELHEALSAAPDDANAAAALEDLLRESGEEDWRTRAKLMRSSLRSPELQKAGKLLANRQFSTAERVLGPFLLRNPDSVPALRMTAELASHLGRHSNAVGLLRRVTELEPDYVGVRYDLALALYRSNNLVEATEELREVLQLRPASLPAALLNGVALGRLGRHDDAITNYEDALGHFPDEPKLYISYGHALRSVGRLVDSVAAYRRAIAISPGSGTAWWSLANLKTKNFDEADVGAMTEALATPNISRDDRVHLNFALGKALEDQQNFPESFAHYAQGNRLRRASLSYDPAAVSKHVQSSKALFSPTFFEERATFGARSTEPIFVVGMPRAGSTLVEQILASHPQVEGMAELTYIPSIAEALASSGVAYPDDLAKISADHAAMLGGEYIARAKRHRRTDCARFVDKNPNNWMHIGLIRLILPNAQIVDVRRHPIACGLSNFKQLFAKGQPFSYSLEEFGRYYRDYVELMGHFDAVLPQSIFRVIYEELVADTELQTRQLLDQLQLPFNEACLRFYENSRAVRTPSSEQVRQPINQLGIERWSNFEPWLGSLKTALGPVLETYSPKPDHR
ncbi:MAG: sulfotransferase [Pseudomonadota bacterium]|nr:sulfotransferase [Pseudomonadota bacterium]